MKLKILSLFLALSMLMPAFGAFPLTSSAENTDINQATDLGDILAQDKAEDADIARHEEESDDIFALEQEDLNVDMIEEASDDLPQTQAENTNVELYADSEVILPLEQYDAKLSAIAAKLGTNDPMVLTKNEEYVNVLLQRRLVDKTGYETLTAKMGSDADFAASMEWLFSDIQMLRYYSFGGEPEANGRGSKNKVANSATYMSSFDVLSKIYTKHKEDLNGAENAPLYKRMIAAIALTHSVPIYDWPTYERSGRQYKWIHSSDPVGRYELYKKFYNFGFLAAEFELYNVEELRMVMGAPFDNAQLEWMQHYYRVKYLKNPDYATRVVPTQPSNVSGRCGMRYATNGKDPNDSSSKQCWDKNNYDMWNEKYMLSVHDEYFDFKVDYGFNEQGQYYLPTWIVIELGGVCVDNSFAGVLVRNAFGLAARYLCQPLDKHMSFLTYNYNGGAISLGSGYDIAGIARSNFTAYGYTHLPAGWEIYFDSGSINSSFIYIGIDAMYSRHDTDYEQSECLVYLAEIEKGKENYEEALSLYNKALEAQYFNYDAYINIALLYEKLGKTEDDYYELAKRASENLKAYAHPTYEYIMKFIYPHINNPIKKADLIALTRDTLSKGNGVGASYCRDSLLARQYPIAAFNFSTRTISIEPAFRNTGTDFLYSFDGGETWNTHIYAGRRSI